MRVRKLQCKLVSDVIYMRQYGREADEWERHLEEYGEHSRSLFWRLGISP